MDPGGKDELIKCLNHISEEEPDDHVSFLDYTQEWITRVNRGRLFVISDIVYRAFYAIE